MQPYGKVPALVNWKENDPPGLMLSDLKAAAVTVWSAGPGRPGLLEPMGVHRGYRGRGYGKAITVAAAAALQRLGSSSAIVCTPSSNVGAVATYEAAGFRRLPQTRDRYRDVGAVGPRSAATS